MPTLPSVVKKGVDRLLQPGEEVKRAYYSSCSKTGGPGESWLVATRERIIIGSQSLASDMQFVSYPLSKIEGIERDGHGLGRGTLYFVSGGGKLDQFTYTTLESDTFVEADHEILALMKQSGIKVKPPTVPPLASTVPPVPAKEHATTPLPLPKPVSTVESKPAPTLSSPKPVKTPDEAVKTTPVRRIPVRQLAPSSKRAEAKARAKETPTVPGKTTQKPPEPQVPLQRTSGKGSSKIQILLPPGTYYPGETIPGKVALKLGKEETISTRGIRLHLMGSEKVSVTRGSGKSSTTYTEKHTIIEEETVLFGQPSMSFGDTVSDAFEYLTGTKKAPQFPGGNHEWDVQLLLPPGAPPSFKGRYGKVNYTVKAYVDVPMGFDIVKHVELSVADRDDRRLLQFIPLNEKTGGVMSLLKNQSDVLLRAAVGDLVWGKDQQIHGSLSFENPAERTIRGVRIRACYVEEAWPKGVRARSEWKSKENYARLGFTGKSFPEKPFKLPIPPGPLPFQGRCFKLDLIVEVALDLPVCPDFRILFVAVPKRTST